MAASVHRHDIPEPGPTPALLQFAVQLSVNDEPVVQATCYINFGLYPSVFVVGEASSDDASASDSQASQKAFPGRVLSLLCYTSNAIVSVSEDEMVLHIEDGRPGLTARIICNESSRETWTDAAAILGSLLLQPSPLSWTGGYVETTAPRPMPSPLPLSVEVRPTSHESSARSITTLRRLQGPDRSPRLRGWVAPEETAMASGGATVSAAGQARGHGQGQSHWPGSLMRARAFGSAPRAVAAPLSRAARVAATVGRGAAMVQPFDLTAGGRRTRSCPPPSHLTLRQEMALEKHEADVMRLIQRTATSESRGMSVMQTAATQPAAARVAVLRRLLRFVDRTCMRVTRPKREGLSRKAYRQRMVVAAVRYWLTPHVWAEKRPARSEQATGTAVQPHGAPSRAPAAAAQGTSSDGAAPAPIQLLVRPAALREGSFDGTGYSGVDTDALSQASSHAPTVHSQASGATSLYSVGGRPWKKHPQGMGKGRSPTLRGTAFPLPVADAGARSSSAAPAPGPVAGQWGGTPSMHGLAGPATARQASGRRPRGMSSMGQSAYEMGQGQSSVQASHNFGPEITVARLGPSQLALPAAAHVSGAGYDSPPGQLAMGHHGHVSEGLASLSVASLDGGPYEAQGYTPGQLGMGGAGQMPQAMAMQPMLAVQGRMGMVSSPFLLDARLADTPGQLGMGGAGQMPQAMAMQPMLAVQGRMGMVSSPFLLDARLAGLRFDTPSPMANAMANPSPLLYYHNNQDGGMGQPLGPSMAPVSPLSPHGGPGQGWVGPVPIGAISPHQQASGGGHGPMAMGMPMQMGPDGVQTGGRYWSQPPQLQQGMVHGGQPMGMPQGVSVSPSHGTSMQPQPLPMAMPMGRQGPVMSGRMPGPMGDGYHAAAPADGTMIMQTAGGPVQVHLTLHPVGHQPGMSRQGGPGPAHSPGGGSFHESMLGPRMAGPAVGMVQPSAPAGVRLVAPMGPASMQLLAPGGPGGRGWQHGPGSYPQQGMVMVGTSGSGSFSASSASSAGQGPSPRASA